MKLRKITLRGLAALLLCGVFFALPISVAGAETAEEMHSGWIYDFPPDAASVNISLDGERVLEGEAAILNDVTYVPLRSFAELFGTDSITWNARTSTATVKKGNTVINIGDRLHYIEASGRYFYSSVPTRNISDRLFVPIRAIAKAFCVDVGWDNGSRTVTLKATGEELLSADRYYSADDLYWLSRIINAESGGESLIGKIAVGNVVINRKNSRSYPNTIYGVIFDRNGGTQFSPVAMGTIYRTPSAESIMAAKICLDGYSVDTGILFFMNPRIATNNWISKNRPFAFRIGNHHFYY